MTTQGMFVNGDESFARSEALLGAEALARLAAARVLVVGVGGVGSWCAEALARTGVGRLTLVDHDVVAASNINRQCPATAKTLGRPKVAAMAARLLEINPQMAVETRCEKFESFAAFGADERFDMVVDAIDSVASKAELILGATAAGVPVVSSMGAARRMDPTQVKTSRFEKVAGDGLARALRQRFKRLQRFPAARFTCVWSTEPPSCAAGRAPDDTTDSPPPLGSLMPVTATFGMCLAAETIRILTKGATE